MKEEIVRTIPDCLNIAVLGFNFLEVTEKEKKKKQEYGEEIHNQKTSIIVSVTVKVI
jgi:hypothetical protein